MKAPTLFTLCVASTILFLAGPACALPSPREITPLTQWEFTEDTAPVGSPPLFPTSAAWQAVEVPHVFRQSGLPDNAAGWYRVRFDATPAGQPRRIYLCLEGAASVKDVYVNGQYIGQHKGAFSRASFDLTPALKTGTTNVLDVRVGNRDEEARGCFSRSTLFYINGGMFRKASLLTLGSVYICPDMGSTGLYLTPQKFTGSSAQLSARALIRNTRPTPAKVTVQYTVRDPSGVPCASFETVATLAPDATAILEAAQKIDHPRLWDLGVPDLYSVKATVSVDGTITDELTERTGFRTIAWKQNRFYLNGREVQFRGVCKHAQDEYKWNAMGDKELREEWDDMKKLGLNAARLAHYPHASLEYDMADERGIAVWAENGYAGQSWKQAGPADKSATPDGDRLSLEMVRQNWNHPSILFWSAGNEAVVDVVSHYAALIRAEDSSRLTTYAANTAAKEPHPKNCDFVAENTYDGWYSGAYSDFAELPRNALISETGAGDWMTHHVPYGVMRWTVDRFEPEEYAETFAEFRLQTIFRSDVANRPMFFWWNYREFYNSKFKANRNTKGLRTLAGMRKDVWYLFQSFMNPRTRVVHLNGRHNFLRTFAADNGIKAYANAAELQLILNGEPKEKIMNGSYRIADSEFKEKAGTVRQIPGIPVANVFLWKTPLKPGKNVVEVVDERSNRDSMVVYQQTGVLAKEEPTACIRNLQSPSSANPAMFIDRPVEAQGPVYTDVDGSSDNTFDEIPPEVQGAGWIATRRLSVRENRADVSFSISKGVPWVDVFVLLSVGTYPTVTLKAPDREVVEQAGILRSALKASGFKLVPRPVTWRDHEANRANAELWTFRAEPGATVRIPGATLDYVVLVKQGGQNSLE